MRYHVLSVSFIALALAILFGTYQFITPWPYGPTMLHLKFVLVSLFVMQTCWAVALFAQIERLNSRK